MLRDAANNLNTNADRIVPDRPKMSIIQQQAQAIQQLQQQLMMMTGQGQPGQPQPQQAPQSPQATLPDGSPAGGRDANLMSPRPNGA